MEFWDGQEGVTTECRRRGERILVPLEIELSTRTGPTTGIVRDISVLASTAIGLAVFHDHALPEDQPVLCRLLEPCDIMPDQFYVYLRWSRNMGEDGFLSGGVIQSADDEAEA